MELLQRKKIVNATAADLLRTLDVVARNYITDAYSLDVSAAKFSWHTKKQFEDYIDTKEISEISLAMFFQTTRAVINETIRSTLRQLEKKGLINLESSICLMRTVTKTIDGKMKTLTEKHFLSPEEHKHYLALLKEIEGKYNIDRKRLFFSKQASEELDEAKQFLAEAIKKLAMNHEEYEFYTTSYIIRITESGMKEQISNVAESKKVLTEAIGASVLNKCFTVLISKL